MMNVTRYMLWIGGFVLFLIFASLIIGSDKPPEYLYDLSSASEYIRFGCQNPAVTPVKYPVSSDSKGEKMCSKGEKTCRRVLEDHFGRPFKTTRSLDFLRNPETNRLLELDGYNEDFKIAFEFNGRQHYEWPNQTNQTEHDFIQQKRRDIFKREQCDLNGVYLITVPYTVVNIKEFILSSLPG